MASEQNRGGFLERAGGFMERLNIAIGAVALTGAVVLESTALGVIGALQLAEAAFWRWVKDRKNKKSAPKLAAAPG